MFLKSITLQGFKSFADKTIIHFDKPMVGIVGPNGCGKSNINDAIRWVLGEQSVKSLRGNTMSDVIFSGSATKKSVNVAKVSLTFNNTNRFFDIDFDEVEITRCLHRVDNENTYFINKTPCRLKDITNLIMDSGLGKDSLSIISQGNISSFAEAKPYERRAIFEEAASVSKYKKRKTESMNKLERTNENLLRLHDIIYELERQIDPLEKHAKKAKIFLEKEKRLREIEISVLVDNIETYVQQQLTYKEEIYQTQMQLEERNDTLDKKEKEVDTYKKQIYQLDYDVHQLQEQLVSHMNIIKQLESKKIEIEEKRKYQKNSEDSHVKKQLLYEELKEVEYEFENRQNRLSEIKHEINFTENEIQSISKQIQLLTSDLSKTKHYLSTVQNDLNVNEKLMKQPFLSHQGVKNILEAKHLVGIHQTVSQTLQPIENYELAINASLNSLLYHVFVENSEAGKQAVKYLKKNNGGRATFLPIDLLKPRTITKEQEIICESVAGYLGLASDFVVCDKKFEQAKNSLLGNIVICNNIDEANELSARLKQQLKIITMDGDVIHKGGSITGGSVKQNHSYYSLQKENDRLNAQAKKYTSTIQRLEENLQQLNNQLSKYQSDSLKLQLDSAKLTTVIDTITYRKNQIENEYESLVVDKEVQLQFDDTLIKQLTSAIEKQEEITSLTKNKRKIRLDIAIALEQYEIEIRTIRREIGQLSTIKQQTELAQVKIQTKLENEMDILRNQYQMTFEYAKTQVIDVNIEEARQEVLTLKNEITKLGHINLDAPEQYEEVRTRYEHLSKQVNELNQAKSDILNAIDEMDEMMKTQFKETFDRINTHLNVVFKSLFPSGQATLILSEPEDLLNTGIDIHVSFPGKTLRNIRLFSGGEKALVAICVLFAIIKARTMPLCIFDEVEAALDQVNVDKFANYIASLKDETQFIVVTHRPGTMVKCDSLFGVTMQQSGVSSILSVQIEDAISMIKEK